MTKANECTCPSGDGSLRHPCPAHPASVELAGVAANLTFINGRPAMCGCQVEYSSGGGEYSDVIYVTLCAKHSGSAILDLVATNRIALTPEYEGQWHADLYLDREIPLAKAEGATPAEAVLALMSAERIDPEQGGVDQAGGDRWDALQSIMEWTAAENIPDDRKLCLIRNAARAALAQPSPKCEFCGGTGEISGVEGEDDWVNGPCPRCAYPAQAEQAEAERPEVVGYLLTKGNGTLSILRAGSSDEPVMTVAQHDRIVDALRFERQQMDRAFTACINERDSLAKRWDEAVRYGARIEEQRDAALARVEQQERTIAGMNEAHAKLAGLYEAAQAQHSVPAAWYYDAPSQAEAAIIDIRGMWGEDDCPTYEDVASALRRLLAAAPGKEVPQAWLDVQAERRRQVEAEGWTPEHDDLYCAAELPRAAAAYILKGANDEAPAIWPFVAKWWKPRDARSNYVRAGALILAEIERLDRAAPGKEVGHE
ncbi:TPA: hypothetical protein ACIDZK_001495 [Pseudomonas aeruginosa]